MTVTYTAEVANSSFSCFLKLLVRWRGSIYKLLWKDLLAFLICYYILSASYRLTSNSFYKKKFETLATYCDTYSNLIPVAFVLAFYVSIVVGRWWEQLDTIPWPDRIALFLIANLHGNDDKGRQFRRTIIRYVCLSYVITMTSISLPVKKRFPTFTHMTEAGFMLENEEKLMFEIPTDSNKYFVPLAWATNLLSQAKKEGRIKDDFAYKTLVDEMNDIRGKLGTLLNYDWISVPLVYTQVVTLAVYTFFLACLMGRQFLETMDKTDMYVPIFTLLQFLFYMGWLKVAECLVNPFGEDDDDFDINGVIDRNLQVAYLIADRMYAEVPPLSQDDHWDEFVFDLPYTAASEARHNAQGQMFMGSAMDVELSETDAEFVLPMITEDEEEQEGQETEGNEHPTVVVHASSDRQVEAKASSRLKKKKSGSKGALNAKEQASHIRQRRQSMARRVAAHAGRAASSAPTNERILPNEIPTSEDVQVECVSSENAKGQGRTSVSGHLLPVNVRTAQSAI